MARRRENEHMQKCNELTSEKTATWKTEKSQAVTLRLVLEKMVLKMCFGWKWLKIVSSGELLLLVLKEPLGSTDMNEPLGV
jgi:hypothetical protein